MAPVAALLYLVFSLATIKRPWRSQLYRLGAFVAPLLAVLPNTLSYIDKRAAFHLQTFQAASLGGDTSRLANGAAFLGAQLLVTIESLFVQIRMTDSLLRWEGPLLNALLLPFLVVGLLYLAFTFKRRHHLFMILWFVLLH